MFAAARSAVPKIRTDRRRWPSFLGKTIKGRKTWRRQRLVLFFRPSRCVCVWAWSNKISIPCVHTAIHIAGTNMSPITASTYSMYLPPKNHSLYVCTYCPAAAAASPFQHQRNPFQLPRRPDPSPRCLQDASPSLPKSPPALVACANELRSP